MIRILLVDDQNLVQQGIKSLLEQDPEFKVIGTVKDGRSAVRQVNDLHPDLVLLDIEMPGMDGITATKYITRLSPQVKVVILSSHEDKKYLTHALMAGAKAYILKSSLMTDLKQSIIAVNNGYSYIESRLLAKIFDPSNIKQSESRKANHQVKKTGANSLKSEIQKTEKNNYMTTANEDNLADAVKLNPPVKTIETVHLNHNIQSDSNLSDLRADKTVPKINLSHLPPVEVESFSGENNSAEIARITNSEETFRNLLPATAIENSRLLLSTDNNHANKSLTINVNSNHGRAKKIWSTIAKFKTELAQLWAVKKLQSKPVIRRYEAQFSRYKSQLLPLLRRWHEKGWLANGGLVFLGLITVIIIHLMFS